MKQIESNPMEEIKYMDMVKPPGKQSSDSTRRAKDGINDIPGSEIYEKDNTDEEDIRADFNNFGITVIVQHQSQLKCW